MRKDPQTGAVDKASLQKVEFEEEIYEVAVRSCCFGFKYSRLHYAGICGRQTLFALLPSSAIDIPKQYCPILLANDGRCMPDQVRVSVNMDFNTKFIRIAYSSLATAHRWLDMDMDTLRSKVDLGSKVIFSGIYAGSKRQFVCHIKFF